MELELEYVLAVFDEIVRKLDFISLILFFDIYWSDLNFKSLQDLHSFFESAVLRLKISFVLSFKSSHLLIRGIFLCYFHCYESGRDL